MKFTLNRNLTLASTTGHCVEFKKDVATFVPTAMWAEVKKIGAVPEDELPEEAVDKSPTDQGVRDKAIREAIMAITLKNDRDDFQGGRPGLRALQAITGWSVSAKERDRVLQAMSNDN